MICNAERLVTRAEAVLREGYLAAARKILEKRVGAGAHDREAEVARGGCCVATGRFFRLAFHTPEAPGGDAEAERGRDLRRLARAERRRMERLDVERAAMAERLRREIAERESAAMEACGEGGEPC